MSNVIAIANMIGSAGSLTPTVSTAITPISIKGGVIRNIDQATGDIAVTTSSTWIEDEKYATRAIITGGSASLEFDSAVTRTGRLTVKVSTLDTSARARTQSPGTIDPGTNSTVSLVSKYGIPVKAATSYTFNCYCKTTTAAANSVFCNIGEYKISDGTSITTNATNKLTGTNDWTLLTKTFTTNAATTHVAFSFLQNVAGDISDAWFDINSMTLEEVSTITNPLSYAVKLYPSVTAVSSTDNIDQSQVVVAGDVKLGDNTRRINGQSVVLTKSKITGLVLRKGANVGSPTFDVKVSIQADTAGSPSGTDLGTAVTYTAAQWDALTDNTDFTVPYILTVTPGTFWIVTTPSAQGDSSNYRVMRISGATNPYTVGGLKFFNGSAWSSLDTSYDLYFKTLYSKNTANFTVRTDTETLSVTAPTVGGWANGTVIDTTDGTYGIQPVTLAPGDNTVYISSNGSTLADSDTDESLQCTFGGVSVG